MIDMHFLSQQRINFDNQEFCDINSRKFYIISDDTDIINKLIPGGENHITNFRSLMTFRDITM